MASKGEAMEDILSMAIHIKPIRAFLHRRILTTTTIRIRQAILPLPAHSGRHRQGQSQDGVIGPDTDSSDPRPNGPTTPLTHFSFHFPIPISTHTDILTWTLLLSALLYCTSCAILMVHAATNHLSNHPTGLNFRPA